MRYAALVLALLPLAAVADGFSLASRAFHEGGSIPTEHSCEGDETSPQLSWSGAPAGTKSYALIVTDPDAPDPAAPTMVWTHWVLYNIKPDVAELAAGDDLPPSAMAGNSSWGWTGYGGPCPPVGNHRYFFRLYALDTVLADLGQPSREQLETAMVGHIIGEAVLMGRYQRGAQP